MRGLIPLLLMEVLAYVSPVRLNHAHHTADPPNPQLYLTLRFLVPLLRVHFTGNGLLLPLKRVVTRTVIATAITMLSTLAVKISLTLFNGEPAWLCCMTCKIDGESSRFSHVYPFGLLTPHPSQPSSLAWLYTGSPNPNRPNEAIPTSPPS
jgi:hypothetical protein